MIKTLFSFKHEPSGKLHDIIVGGLYQEEIDYWVNRIKELDPETTITAKTYVPDGDYIAVREVSR